MITQLTAPSRETIVITRVKPTGSSVTIWAPQQWTLDSLLSPGEITLEHEEYRKLSDALEGVLSKGVVTQSTRNGLKVVTADSGLKVVTVSLKLGAAGENASRSYTGLLRAPQVNSAPRQVAYGFSFFPADLVFVRGLGKDPYWVREGAI